MEAASFIHQYLAGPNTDGDRGVHSRVRPLVPLPWPSGGGGLLLSHYYSNLLTDLCLNFPSLTALF